MAHALFMEAMLEVLKRCSFSFQLQIFLSILAMANKNQTPMKFDATTMEMFEAFNLYMQQQQSTQHKEFTITKCS